MESIPQTHIMMTLFVLFNPEKIAKLTGGEDTSDDNNPLSYILDVEKWGVEGLDASTLVTCKFAITILTSAWGIAQFLSKSPLRAISKDGLCMGYLRCTFFTLFFGSLFWLAGRTWLLVMAITSKLPKEQIPIVLITWISTNFIVQALLVRQMQTIEFLNIYLSSRFDNHKNVFLCFRLSPLSVIELD